MATNAFHNNGSAAVAGSIHRDLNIVTNNYSSEPDPIPNGINFRVAKPETNFTGRSNELDRLKEILLSTNAEAVVVSGMGGIGKTQLGRKFISENRSEYANVIWIDSENEANITESFKQLSKDTLHLPTTDANGKDKDSRSIIERVVSKLCQRKTLFVYDNVDKLTEIMKFILAMMTPPSRDKPHILITSRLQKWFDGIEVIRLTVWNRAQATEYISGILTDSPCDSPSDKELLAITLQFFPLALRQATAYINQQRQMDGTFRITQYIDKYTLKTGEMLNQGDTSSSYDKTTYTTWDITIDAIQRDGINGKLAIRILKIVAYFEPDDIERCIFFQLTHVQKRNVFSRMFPKSKNPTIDKDHVKSAVDLLIRYCLIDSVQAQDIFSVHRLVQEVTKFKLKDSKTEKIILKDAVKFIGKASRERTTDFCRYHFISVLLNASRLKNFEQLLALVPVEVLSDLTQYEVFQRSDKIIELGDIVLGPLTKILGENDRSLLRFRLNVAQAYMDQHLRVKALKEYLDIYNRQKTHFGEGDLDTLHTNDRITRFYRSQRHFSI